MSTRLSPLDAAFLQVEDPENRMQLAGMLIFLGSPPTYEEFRDAVAARLLDLPRFKERLALAPLGLTRPRWVADSAFDLDYHLSRVALPEPGGHDEITSHIDQLTAAPLDLRRPLWEVGLVEGLEDGFAISSRCTTAWSTGCRSSTSSPRCSDRTLPSLRESPAQARPLRRDELRRRSRPACSTGSVAHPRSWDRRPDRRSTEDRRDQPGGPPTRRCR